MTRLESFAEGHWYPGTGPGRSLHNAVTGEPVAESDDLFGSAVQPTARICGVARAGAILVSPEVKDACTAVGLGFEPTGPVTLKGFSELVQLYSPIH